ncbi:MAG: hypothetical protein LYZ66_00310 [Nitrososphaerales archaeon]|nr:hypothetical protein [Nitrososphaerales archaeon]
MRKDTVHIRLEFSDNWRPQIEQIKEFLNSQGIPTGGIHKMAGGAFALVVSAQSGLIKAVTKMLEHSGCLHKKRDELLAVLEYLTDRITGTEFMERLNRSDELGNRVGKIRHVRIPYTHAEGSRQRYERSATKRRLLTDEQKKQIVIDRQLGTMTYRELAAKYGVSITVIATALGKHGRRND